MARVAFLFVSSLAITACARFLATEEAPAPPDASAADAGGSDALADSDDGAVAVSDGASPCDARFCCDFDEADGGCAWTGSTSGQDGGFVTFGATTSVNRSPPRSLEVLTDGSQDGVQQALTVVLSSDQPAAIHFDVLVRQASGSSSIHPFEIRCGGGRMAIKLKTAFGPLDIGSGNDVSIATTYPKDKWFHVDVTLEWPDAGSAVFHGNSDAPGSTARTTDALPCTNPVAFFGGIVVGSGTYELYLDDIVIE